MGIWTTGWEGLLPIPYRQMQTVRWGDPTHSTKALPCFHAANQPVTMHDLKQGLGPSGTDGPRKLTYNKYKLKVSPPHPCSSGRSGGAMKGHCGAGHF